MVDARQVLAAVGLDAAALDAGALVVRSPIDGSLIARLAPDAPEQVGAKIVRAQEAFLAWRGMGWRSRPWRRR